jgi:hypothetical protein
VVLDAATADAWVAELADAGIDVADEVAEVVAGAGTEDVAVGAAISGCAEETAELVIGPGSDLAVELIGPADVLCDAEDTYVALFVVPAELLG